MSWAGRRIALVVGFAFLTGCASVDQFGGRIYDGNRNSQDALNQETLLNIIRASKYQTPNFIGISQINGGQTETLSTGLPTINIGPHQTAAQQIYSVTNNLSSAVNSSYQANPLISTAFQEGTLSAVTFRELAMLIASHPREVVFNMAIDEIILSWQGKNYKYRNDPSYNASPSTYANGNYRYKVDDVCKNELAELSDNRRTPFGSREDLFEGSEECNYTKFQFWLRYLLDYGLTARLLQTAQAKANGSSAPSPTTNTIASKSTSSSTGNSTPPASTGQLCFDELLKPSDLSGGTSVLSCNKNWPSGGGKTHVPFTFTTGGVTVSLQSISFRSTLGLFDYAAKAWQSGDSIPFRTADAYRLHGPQLVSIVPGTGATCYASVNFGGQSWCVPEDAEQTAVVIDILQEMRNLSIQPSDLNASFSVHVTN